jgi:hypothetical protein
MDGLKSEPMSLLYIQLKNIGIGIS